MVERVDNVCSKLIFYWENLFTSMIVEFIFLNSHVAQSVQQKYWKQVTENWLTECPDWFSSMWMRKLLVTQSLSVSWRRDTEQSTSWGTTAPAGFASMITTLRSTTFTFMRSETIDFNLNLEALSLWNIRCRSTILIYVK